MENKRKDIRPLSPERVDIDTIREQSKVFSENEILISFANSLSQMVVVLNPERQIIFANQLFLDFLLKKNLDSVLGKRPGEATECIYSDLVEGGCGHSPFCRTCGAVNSILESQIGKQSVQECNILNKENEALDLQITSTPYRHNGYEFTIFALNDVSHEKRRENLERLFFHDVLNSAGGILDLSNVLQEVGSHNEMSEIAEIIKRTANSMVYEISSQRQLLAAERGDLSINISENESLAVLHDLTGTYSKQDIASKKNIVIDPSTENCIVKTDPVLLKRVLGNMLKNALEASIPGSVITLFCIKKQDKIRFAVHNQNFIPSDIQLQIFKRSFSTKGTGRGLGTYSMKLLGEKYLGGKVSFTSTHENGTTFSFEI
jgi:signal transduction histidine kinase